MKLQIDDQEVLIDNVDAKAVLAHNWSIFTANGGMYVRTWHNDTPLMMHWLVIGKNPDGVVDHRNGNGLDNRRENLRFCSYSQNLQNRGLIGKRSKSRSKYKGVCGLQVGTRPKPWLSYINFDSRRIYLGYFATEEEAARSYDSAALIHHGEFAKTNQSMGLLT